MAERRKPWAIVVAGGSGARFGSQKQLAAFGGRRVIDWSLDAMRSHVDGVIAVLPADLVSVDASGGMHSEVAGLNADLVVAGGLSRSASVRAGLAVLPAEVTEVLVHDAARPLADAALVGRVVSALAHADAVVPVVPVTDTLRRADGGAAERSEFVAVQTPQGFTVSALRGAHRENVDATDDASLIDAAGGTVVHVAGDPRNLKITVPHDLQVAAVLMSSRAATETTDEGDGTDCAATIRQTRNVGGEDQ